MSKTIFELVGEFQKAFGCTVRTEPTLNVSAQEEQLRLALMQEEWEELKNAVEDKNLIEIADALADIVYIACGTAHTYGIPFDKVLHEVHYSNMSKMGEDGKPYIRHNGKVGKGPNYQPPRISSILEGQLTLPGFKE